MAIDKMDDGVGKKIVDALKMQDQEDEIFEEDNIQETPVTDDNDKFIEEDEDSNFDEQFNEPKDVIYNEENVNSPGMVQQEVPVVNLPQNQNTMGSFVYSSSQDPYLYHQMPKNFVDTAFQQSLERNIPANNYNQSYETHTNVEILKQLIAKLPAGVSKQTGAIIIQQTMEALGISMKSVIAEARQVQSELSANVRECQANIVDYRKQITSLESKVQQNQKQIIMLGDIIGLFVNGNIK